MKIERRSKDEATIRALIDRWSRAVEAKDAAAIVEAYTPNTILYDAIPPHRTVGADAIKAIWQQCFPYFPERFRSEHKDLAVEVDGDIAFVHGLHHFVPEPADHPCGSTWMRVTACYRRIGGRWRVVHEHVSIPFNPVTGKASYITDAGDAAATTLSNTAADLAAAHGVHCVTPHLVCANATHAIEFYKRALGASELMRLPGGDGRLMHACLNINNSSVMLVDEYPEMCNKAPTSLKGTPVTIHLVVDDVDAFAQRAISEGAKVVMPIADMFWGDRYGVIEDPFGHRWSIATPKRSMTAAEVQAAASAAAAGLRPN